MSTDTEKEWELDLHFRTRRYPYVNLSWLRKERPMWDWEELFDENTKLRSYVGHRHRRAVRIQWSRDYEKWEVWESVALHQWMEEP